jgi:hypothetical protein
MATLKDSRDDPRATAAAAPVEVVAEESIEARRARRMAALKKVAGIWAERPDIPADGLDYQRALRSEWRA